MSAGEVESSAPTPTGSWRWRCGGSTIAARCPGSRSRSSTSYRRASCCGRPGRRAVGAAPSPCARAGASIGPATRSPGSSTSMPGSTSDEIETIWRASWLFCRRHVEARRAGRILRLRARRRFDDHRPRRRRRPPRAAQHLPPPRHARVSRRRRPRPPLGVPLPPVELRARRPRCSAAAARTSDVDRAAHGLHRAAVAEVGGLIFVWLGRRSRAVRRRRRGAAAPRWRRRGSTGREVAHRIDYEVRGQLEARVGEQPRVLALPRRPSRVRARQLRRRARPSAPPRATSPVAAAQHAVALATSARRRPTSTTSRASTASRSAGRWWSANRTPLVPGFVTESLDGRPVAPLMGDYAGL